MNLDLNDTKAWPVVFVLLPFFPFPRKKTALKGQSPQTVGFANPSQTYWCLSCVVHGSTTWHVSFILCWFLLVPRKVTLFFGMCAIGIHWMFMLFLGSYCWWKKSWSIPVFTVFFYIPGGLAGFLPSTVLPAEPSGISWANLIPQATEASSIIPQTLNVWSNIPTNAYIKISRSCIHVGKRTILWKCAGNSNNNNNNNFPNQNCQNPRQLMQGSWIILHVSLCFLPWWKILRSSGAPPSQIGRRLLERSS